MPDDRFIHPRLGHSEKVNALNDLEFRVWNQYLLSADDFGIMRASALALQADNDSLARRPLKVIQRALERILEIGLLLKFDHQGRQYVCDPRWQDFQRVRWPRTTKNPAPSEQCLGEFTEATRKLITDHFGSTSEVLFGDHAIGHRLTAKANGKRQAATANGFDRFWEMYPRKVNKDAARREFDKLAPDNDLLDTMLAALHQQRASAQWLKDDGQFIPHARTWLHQKRWTDEVKVSKAVNATASTVGKRQLVPDDEPL